MKEFVIDIRDDIWNMDCVDSILELFHKCKFSEQITFIWIMHPKMFFSLHNVHDANCNFIQKHSKNMDWLFDRPIFYDENISEGKIIFREYR